MSRKMGYHLTPCNESNPLLTFLGTLFVFGLVAWGICALCVWFYHHVILPVLHFAFAVLLYGSMALGALGACLLILGLIMWAQKRGERHDSKSSVRNALSTYRLRPRMASQNDVPALAPSPRTANQENPAGTVIDSTDKVWALMHGIDWDK